MGSVLGLTPELDLDEVLSQSAPVPENPGSLYFLSLTGIHTGLALGEEGCSSDSDNCPGCCQSLSLENLSCLGA